MDDTTKRELIEAEKCTPRFLFRAWSNSPPVSGGFVGLNTVDAITPRAFLHRRCDLDKTVFDLTRSELEVMCSNHLCTNTTIFTEFSSWAGDLCVALSFAASHRNGGYISIIDTCQLPNRIFHVPSLAPILGKSSYDWEYLAHGVISGDAYKAVPLQAMLNIGIPTTLWRNARLSTCTNAQWERRRDGSQITPTECENARSVAEQYGSRFGAAVFVALLCLKQRDPTLWRDGTNDVEFELNEYLLDFEVLDTTCYERGILTNIVYTKGFGGLEQMIRMLRAIKYLRHGTRA